MSHSRLDIISIVFYCLVIRTSLAVIIGEHCTRQSECKSYNSYCAIQSPTCGIGTCTCVPGFTYDSTDDSCKRTVEIGNRCNPGDACSSENAHCSNGTCECKTGYKLGLKGGDCISTLKQYRYNAKCYDSVECYYNMVCLLNQCTCYHGYKVIGDYACASREVGDRCESQLDCSRTPNTECANGVCGCKGGYKQIEFMTSSTKTKLACISNDENLREEGSECTTSVKKSKSALCSKPFVCTACGSGSAKCSRVMPFYLNTANQFSAISTRLITILSAFYWFL